MTRTKQNGDGNRRRQRAATSMTRVTSWLLKGGKNSWSGGPNSVYPGCIDSTLRKQLPAEHTQPTPPVLTCGGSSNSGAGGGGACGGGCGGTGGASAVAWQGTSSASPAESTTVIYNFHDDDVPFVARILTRPVTLNRFKEHLPRKGNYRFYFKKQCEEFGVIQEEITDDYCVLPLFDGKIFAQIQRTDQP